MSTFGSSADEDPATIEELEGRISRGERASVAGLFAEMDTVKAKLEAVYDQLTKCHQAVSILQRAHQEFRAQYVTMLQMKVNHGPTNPEDFIEVTSGPYDQPSD